MGGVTRRFIFPTLRILIWALIAAALVKIAFNGASVETQDTGLLPPRGSSSSRPSRSRPAP